MNKISGKLKIKTEITDEEGNIRTIEEEVDVSDEKNFSESEEKALKMGQKLTSIILEEKLKKKKKWWFWKLWFRIKNMLRMGKRKFKLGEKHSWKHLNDKNSAK